MSDKNEYNYNDSNDVKSVIINNFEYTLSSLHPSGPTYNQKFKEAIDAKDASLLPKYRNNNDHLYFSAILALQDPTFLQQAIDAGWPIAKFTVDDINIYSVYLNILNYETLITPIDTLLKMLNILKENGADIILDIEKYIKNDSINYEPVYNFFYQAMIEKGLDPDYEIYKRTPLHSLAEKFKHKIPESSSDKEKWIGTLCDSLGFFQHYGECWNDAAQMAILYTDGLKELTQPFFYFLNFTPEFVESIPALKDKPQQYLDFTLVYLNSLQRRFRRHYNLEIQRRSVIRNVIQSNNILTKDIVCSPELMREKEVILEAFKNYYIHVSTNPQIAKSKENVFRQYKLSNFDKISKFEDKLRLNALKQLEESGKSYKEMNALQGTILHPTKKYKNYINYLNTLTGGYITEIFKRLLEMCEIPVLKNIKNLYELKNGVFLNSKSYPSSIEITQIHNSIYRSTNAILVEYYYEHYYEKIRGRIGHAALFYVCGNKQYYYEDNSGPVPFMWKDFFKPETWSPLFPGMTKDEYWNKIVISTFSLDKSYVTGKYKHGYYPIIQFKTLPDWYTLAPGETTILKIIIKNQLVQTKSFNKLNFTWNLESSIIADLHLMPYQIDFLFVTVPQTIEIQPNVQSNVPWIPSAIRTKARTRRRKAARRKTRSRR